MKLTWFGNTAFRIHIGGQVVVLNAQTAPAGVDGKELVGGADHVIELGAGRPLPDPQTWRPRPRERLLDAGDAPRPAQIYGAGPDCTLIDADDDRPLLVIGGNVPPLGRWAERAVVVVVGGALSRRISGFVDLIAPHLIALAGEDAELDAVFASLPSKLDGTGLIALEPGLAVEV